MVVLVATGVVMLALWLMKRSLAPGVQTLVAPMVWLALLVTEAGRLPPLGSRETLPATSPAALTLTTTGVPRQAGTLWMRPSSAR